MFGAGGRALRLSVCQGTLEMSRVVSCRLPSKGLGYEHTKGVVLSWYESHFGQCVKCVLVSNTPGNNSGKKGLTLAHSFRGFSPWTAAG